MVKQSASVRCGADRMRQSGGQHAIFHPGRRLPCPRICRVATQRRLHTLSPIELPYLGMAYKACRRASTAWLLDQRSTRNRMVPFLHARLTAIYRVSDVHAWPRAPLQPPFPVTCEPGGIEPRPTKSPALWDPQARSSFGTPQRPWNLDPCRHTRG